MTSMKIGIVKVYVEERRASRTRGVENLRCMLRRPRKGTFDKAMSDRTYLSLVFVVIDTKSEVPVDVQRQLAAMKHHHENSISRPSSICLAYSTPETFRSRKMPKRKQLHNAGKCLNYSKKLYRMDLI